MFDWWKVRRTLTQTATEIYGAIVTRARTPAFYALCGVSDTPEGRYELIVLYMALVLERLRRLETPACRELQRLLVEAFVSDMDDSMREMGVGDMTVPKKVKKAAAGLYERMQQYQTALDGDDGTRLPALLAALIPGLATVPGNAETLAGFVEADRRHLAGLADDPVIQGKLEFAG